MPLKKNNDLEVYIMSTRTTKRNKKEERKKLAVRIVCIALAAALVLTSLYSLINLLAS